MQLFPGSKTAQRFVIVYNLYEFDEGLYLPNAYVVTKDSRDELIHIRHKASEQTINGFEIELTPLRKRLFDLIKGLDPKTLQDRFNPNKKRPKTIEKLLTVPEVKLAIFRYVHRKLDEFLGMLVEHDLPLSWQVERKVIVKDFLFQFHKKELMPHLFFQRTDTGINYKLTLAEEKGPWQISDHEVVPITNHPAWIFVDYVLYRVAHINGNMVKPFRNKNQLFIPGKSVKTYFQKFILKIASKVNIEAEGFEVIQRNKLLGCKLSAKKDLFTDQWILAVSMCYPQVEFNWSDKKKNRTSLDFREGDDISIIRVTRKEKEEKKYLDKLLVFGLENKAGSFFQLSEPSDNLSCFTGVACH